MRDIIQDVVPPEKKSIRNIPLPENRRTKPVGAPPTPPPLPRAKESSGNGEGSRLAIWGVALFAVIVLIFAIFSLFVSATVSVWPRVQKVSLSDEFEARPAGTVSEGLIYQTISLSHEMGKQVDALGEEKVQEKASGTITIFNDYSSAEQVLIANTRFQSPTGLIYRIKEQVVVPGQKEVNGQKTPGQIDVVVYADAAGESYNIGPTDFTIPGFQGDPRYNGFFAKSKTPMSGGFDGTRRVVEDETLETARGELQAELEKELLQQIKTQVPAGFVVLNNLYTFNSEELPQSNATDNSVNINEKGTLSIAVFNEDELSRVIANRAVVNFDESPVLVTNLDELSIEITEGELGETLGVRIRGDAVVEWKIDPSAIQTALAGKGKKEMNAILTKFPAISSAEATIRPFWRRSFPDNAEKINVVKVLDEN